MLWESTFKNLVMFLLTVLDAATCYGSTLSKRTIIQALLKIKQIWHLKIGNGALLYE